ncbi:unnamed protein product [Parnassius mnemosyne]|uniref:Uncharacterized protein n=1 Tax=Parnassius mnemosyne TaxID=213953 RepID=A0AAV1KMN7_9NEOP
MTGHINLHLGEVLEAAQMEQRMLAELHDEVHRSLNLESLGVSLQPRQNKEDVQAWSHLERTATLVEGRWQVGLPWINENSKMPESFSNAMVRLSGVERKIKLNSDYGESEPKESLGIAAVRFKIGQHEDGERTLGLIWYPDNDTLGFDVSFKRIPENISSGKTRPTKREMLRIIMSIFDVYGILSQITIKGKIMLQETCKANIGWDEIVSDAIYKKWCEWMKQLKWINNLRLPRYY